MVKCGGEGDREDVGGDVFDGEVAAEEDFSGEGEAEGVDGGDGDEAAEFEQRGDDDGECGKGWRAEPGQERGEEPVEGDSPENGAEVFVEEPGEVEGEKAHGQADGDGDDEEDKGGERAAHLRFRLLTFLLFQKISVGMTYPNDKLPERCWITWRIRGEQTYH